MLQGNHRRLHADEVFDGLGLLLGKTQNNARTRQMSEQWLCEASMILR